MNKTREPSSWRWPVLHEAQRTVLLEVLIHGSGSRAELARRTGLSRASLSRLSRDLVDIGLVTEGEIFPLPGRGRPAEKLDLRPESAYFVGIKLTGDTLYAAVTDLHASVVATEEHKLVSRDVQDVVVLIAEMVDRFRAGFRRVAAVGVCSAGDVEIVNGHGVLIGSNFLGWPRVHLEELVEAATGLPTTIANDVMALTVAHHWFGAGVGCRSLAVVSFGAGIGSGLVANYQLIRGANGRSGKVSHIPVTADGPVCDQGHVGCASAYVTIPAILRNAGTTSFNETLERFEKGDDRAVRAIKNAGKALGTVVAQIADLLDPLKVIITGEGSDVARLADSELEAALESRRDPAAGRVGVEVYPFHFSDYAWAAAISAIRQVLETER